MEVVACEHRLLQQPCPARQHVVGRLWAWTAGSRGSCLSGLFVGAVGFGVASPRCACASRGSRPVVRRLPAGSQSGSRPSPVVVEAWAPPPACRCVQVALAPRWRKQALPSCRSRRAERKRAVCGEAVGWRGGAVPTPMLATRPRHVGPSWPAAFHCRLVSAVST